MQDDLFQDDLDGADIAARDARIRRWWVELRRKAEASPADPEDPPRLSAEADRLAMELFVKACRPWGCQPLAQRARSLAAVGLVPLPNGDVVPYPDQPLERT